MRDAFDRALAALCAGRSPGEVAEVMALALALAGVVYVMACAFLIMEPLP